MGKIKYEFGQTIGKFGIKFIEETDPIIYKEGRKRGCAKFLCHCGNNFISRIDSVKDDSTKSCGCLNDSARKKNGKKNKIHGMSKSLAYARWGRIKSRCYNVNDKDYSNYGGRGIKVCDRWLESFENFYEDMGECPDHMSIDRIDVNGDYCPENCRWSDYKNQAYNKRRQKNNTSGRTGIYQTKYGKWCAEIKKDGCAEWLGTFATFEEALAVREQKEIEYYGYTKD